MLSRRLLRIKVAQSVYSHIQSNEKDIARTRKELLHSSVKCYELYLLMLELLVDVRKYAQNRMQIGKAKLRPTPAEQNPNMRFVENPIITLLATSVNLEKALGHLSWGDDATLVRAIYNQMIEADYFQQYMSKNEVTFSDHLKLAKNILINHVEDNPLVESQLEDLSIFWLDDIGYALGIALQALTTLKPDCEDIQIQTPFKNEDDKQFATLLLEKTLLNLREYNQLVNDLTKNWELERIAIMDQILLATAIAELINCPSIPVKSTLDEYIEIAKYYSTPQSGTFINGILDKAAVTLTEQGKIVKIGRGLL